MSILKGLIVAIVLIVAVAFGYVAYQDVFRQSLFNRSGTASTSSNNVILDKRTSLNETNDQYNPYNPYPFESANYDMQLSSGSYQATIHTTSTVYVYVKLNGCYDETLYHCTRLQEAFTSSENPPNIATFTVTQSGGYTLTISLQQVGSIRQACGSSYEPACPTANVEVIVTRV